MNDKEKYFRKPETDNKDVQTVRAVHPSGTQILSKLIGPVLGIGVLVAIGISSGAVAIFVLLFLIGISFLLNFFGVLIHAGDTVHIQDQKISIKKLTRNEEVDLSEVNHIQLSYYHYKSAIGKTFYPEFIFETPAGKKSIALSGYFFLDKAAEILTILKSLFPTKQFSIRWNDAYNGKEEIMEFT